MLCLTRWGLLWGWIWEICSNPNTFVIVFFLKSLLICHPLLQHSIQTWWFHNNWIYFSNLISFYPFISEQINHLFCIPCFIYYFCGIYSTFPLFVPDLIYFKSALSEFLRCEAAKRGINSLCTSSRASQKWAFLHFEEDFSPDEAVKIHIPVKFNWDYL